MKKFLCVAAAVLLIASLLAGCGKTVKTTVDAKYADDFAKNYASDISVDDDGNVSYEFTSDKYEEFLEDYYEEVESESKQIIIDYEEADPDTTYGQYVYYNPDITEIIVGVMPNSYDEAHCREEAQQVGELALKYQMNTKDPKGSLTVTYENCNTGDDYFTITVEA